jgi:amidohydrolase
MEESVSMSTHENSVLEVYQVLHTMPEVGFQEHKTAAYLAEELKAAGFSVKTGLGGTGVVGTLDSGKPGPVVMLRADMDALSHTVMVRKRSLIPAAMTHTRRWY